METQTNKIPEDIPILDEESFNDDNYESRSGGESIIEKTTMERFFDSESILYSIEKQMRGYQKSDGKWVYVTKPVARDDFINMTINSLRSVINEGNKISSMEEKEVKFLLLEKNKEFIYSCLDEPTIEDKDMESIINIFDHALQLFMGLVENGVGNKTLRELGAAVANDWEKDKPSEGGFSLNLSDKNLIRLGGRR